MPRSRYWRKSRTTKNLATTCTSQETPDSSSVQTSPCTVYTVGNYHQGDLRFSANSRGNQCTCNALVSLCHLPGLNTVDRSDLDDILVAGDQLYQSIVGTGVGGHLDFLALPSQFSFHDIPYHARLESNYYYGKSVLQEVDVPNLVTLQDALRLSFNSTDLALLMLGDYGMSVFKRKNGSFCLFDPHARDQDGFVASDGKSIFMSFGDLDAMHCHLQKLCSNLSSSPLAFELQPVIIAPQDIRTPVAHTMDPFIHVGSNSASTSHSTDALMSAYMYDQKQKQQQYAQQQKQACSPTPMQSARHMPRKLYLKRLNRNKTQQEKEQTRIANMLNMRKKRANKRTAEQYESAIDSQQRMKKKRHAADNVRELPTEKTPEPSTTCSKNRKNKNKTKPRKSNIKGKTKSESKLRGTSSTCTVNIESTETMGLSRLKRTSCSLISDNCNTSTSGHAEQEDMDTDACTSKINDKCHGNTHSIFHDVMQKDGHEEYDQDEGIECSSVSYAVHQFKKATMHGPSYVCTCCQQMWFRESVTKSDHAKSLCGTNVLLTRCFTNYVSVGGHEWICSSCTTALRDNRVPRFAVLNGMSFPPKPHELELFPLEERLISLRIPFMQLYELPRGRQFSMRGSVVNVPIDIEPTVSTLPRNLSETATVPVKLKRRLIYKSCVYQENVRPHAVLSGLHWLMQNSDLYKQAGIQVAENWLPPCTFDMTQPLDTMNSDQTVNTTASNTVSDNHLNTVDMTHPLDTVMLSDQTVDTSIATSNTVSDSHLETVDMTQPLETVNSDQTVHTTPPNNTVSDSHLDTGHDNLHQCPTTHCNDIHTTLGTPGNVSSDSCIHHVQNNEMAQNTTVVRNSTPPSDFTIHAQVHVADNAQSNIENHDDSSKHNDNCDDYADDNDNFIEVDENENPGNVDTFLDEPVSASTILTFAPGEGRHPLGLFQDPDSEYLSFPSIFCGQRRQESKDRHTSVHYSDICKWEARSADRRVAKCVPNLFYKMKSLSIKQVADRGNFAMRRCKTKGKTYTAGDVTTDSIRQNMVRLDEGYYIFRSLRNSPPYLEKRKKDVFAMIRQLGLPTWFMSLSSADTRWASLLKVLGQFLDGKQYTDAEITDMSWNEKTRLVQADPVTCARFFDHRVQEFIKCVLKSPSHPLGNVHDFFYRVEFQHRGSPHIHMLVWTSQSPVYGESSDHEITEYIDKHVSCTLQVSNSHQDLVALQKHKHTKTCKKKKPKKSLCRFGYPLPPMLQTMVLTPLENPIEQEEYSEKYEAIQKRLDEMDDNEDVTYKDFLTSLDLTEEQYIKAIRSSLSAPKVFLQRKPRESRVNPYMKLLLDAWEANHDVQFVLDAYACATYIVAYINKNERGMSSLLERACKEAREEKSDLRQQVRHIGNQFLNAVEVSAQEAAYLILQMPLTRASREIVFINTSPPDERVFLLKGKDKLEELPANSTDIEANSLIKSYSRRPKILENWCLADFAAQIVIKFPKTCKAEHHFEMLSEDQVDESDDDEDESLTDDNILMKLKNGIVFKKRKNFRVIRYVRFNASIDEENHFREKLLLFLPWRNENNDLLGDHSSYKASFQQMAPIISHKMRIYEHNSEALDEAAARAQVDVIDDFGDLAAHTEHQQAEDDAEGSAPSDAHAFFDPERPENQRHYDIAGDIGLSAAASNTDGPLIAGRIPDDQYEELVTSLNQKQFEFFTHVLHSIKTKDVPLRVFLTGGAGVGKSVVTRALVQALHRYLCSGPGDNPEDCRILVCAPTGKAAHNVGGDTIHRCLRIDPSRKLCEYHKLTADSLNTLRNTYYRDLSVVFIDEVSMVGHNLLNYVNLRLQEIMGKKAAFGGLHVILIGDLFQLEPVMDGWIFKNLKDAFGPLATNLWVDNFTMHELTTIMRQKEDQDFAQLLNRLREGNHTEADIAVLQQCVVEPHDHRYPGAETTHLYPTNVLVDDHNRKLFLECPREKTVIKAVDVLQGNYTKQVQQYTLDRVSKLKASNTASLLTYLPVAVGLRYEITSNIEVKDGLANGATCMLHKIQYITSKVTPAILWVEFDNPTIGNNTRTKYKGYYTHETLGQWTPIFARKPTFYYGKDRKPITRIQFPLRPATAKTIHKAQGQTLSQVVVHMGTRQRRHSHYVALSRVTSISGLYILKLNENKIALDPQVEEEMIRLREHRQLELCYIPVNSSDAKFKVTFQNARSLHRHVHLLKSDHNHQAADIITVAETRLCRRDSNDDYSFPGYILIRADQTATTTTRTDSRPPHGLVAYVRNHINILEVYQMSGTAFESMFLTIDLQFSPASKITVGIVYRSPSFSIKTFKDQFSAALVKIELQSPLMILGDFNIDVLKESNHPHICWIEELTTCTQINTQVTTDQHSLLDHVYTNIEQAKCNTLECAWSDHKGLFCAI